MAEVDVVTVSAFLFIAGLGLLIAIIVLAAAFFIGRWWWEKRLKMSDPNPNFMGAVAAISLLVNFWAFIGYFVLTYLWVKGR